MLYTAYIPDAGGAIASVHGVSPQDAALKAATHWASTGIIYHGDAILVAVSSDDRAARTIVEVTPLGRTLGSIRAIEHWTQVAV